MTNDADYRATKRPGTGPSCPALPEDGPRPPTKPSTGRTAGLVVLVLALAGASLAMVSGKTAAADPASSSPSATTTTTARQDLIAQGKYLATAGDCHACHTRPDGPPFAGGIPIETPFGNIYSTNLTPDPETGIGKWSNQDFYEALHNGHGPNGKLYYPALPYVFFTKVTKNDALAIRAYLASLKPVHYEAPQNTLRWPFNYRFLMYFWRTLFFRPDTFHPDPKRSALYNRGAYLVEGLGHCGACHTPRNFMGAIKPDKALTGAEIGGMFAPNISTDKQSTIRDMTIDDIATFLQTGYAKPEKPGFGPKTSALGPMATVVHLSLSHLSKQDLTAIAAYLKNADGPEGQPGGQTPAAKPALSEGGQGPAAKEAPSKGAQVYAANCSACHGQEGQGLAPFMPALRNNSVVKLESPLNVVRTILDGAPTSPTEQFSPMTMPAFGSVLNDNEVAAVASYIRSHWGNAAPSVDPSQVKSLRKAAAGN